MFTCHVHTSERPLIRSSHPSAGAIAGAVTAGLVVLLAAGFTLWRWNRKRWQKGAAEDACVPSPFLFKASATSKNIPVDETPSQTFPANINAATNVIGGSTVARLGRTSKKSGSVVKQALASWHRGGRHKQTSSPVSPGLDLKKSIEPDDPPNYYDIEKWPPVHPAEKH